MKTRIVVVAALLSASLVSANTAQANDAVVGAIIGGTLGIMAGVALTNNYPSRVEYVSQPVYSQPVYYRQNVEYVPQPSYYRQDVEYFSRPNYYRQPVVVSPPGYYARHGRGWEHHREHNGWNRHERRGHHDD